MFNHTVELHHKGAVTNTTIQELSSNQTILICSLVKPVEYFTFEYIKYLYDLSASLDNYGIKLFLYSTQPMQIAYLDANKNTIPAFEELPCLLDRSFNTLNEFKEKYNKEQPIHSLSRMWIFQAIVSNGAVEFFVEQPTEHQLEHAKRSITSEQFNELIKFNKSKTLKDLLALPESLLYGQNFLYEFSPDYDMLVYKILFFHDVWPSKKLLTYLENSV